MQATQHTCEEEVSLEQLYRQHAQKVFVYLARRTKDETLAEDLCSETFLLVAEALARKQHVFASTAAECKWLYTIARHHLIDYYRRQATQPMLTVEDWSALDRPGESSLEADIEEGETVEALLNTLSAEDRTIIKEYLFEGCTFANIAARHNWGCKYTPCRKYHKAIAALRQQCQQVPL